jgi:hypothetical protein
VVVVGAVLLVLMPVLVAVVVVWAGRIVLQLRLAAVILWLLVLVVVFKALVVKVVFLVRQL